MATSQKSVSTLAKIKPKILLSTHATQAMKSRGISQTQLRHAMLHGSVLPAKEPGREVIRDGNLRLVVERSERSVKVLTAMYSDDLTS